LKAHSRKIVSQLTVLLTLLSFVILVPFQAPSASAVTAGDIQAGEHHTCALFPSQTVECWGSNWYSQLGDGTDKLQSNIPVPVLGLTNVTAISAGYRHTCALLADKTVKCWGDNSHGQLGDGTNTNRNSPVVVLGISNVVAISSSGRSVSTCALLEDGTVRCWGNNSEGQLGDGTNVLSSNQPVQVLNLNNAVSISVGAQSCAVLGDQTVECWGINAAGFDSDGYGQHSNVAVKVSELTDVVKVFSASGSTCALLSNQILKCWGWFPTGDGPADEGPDRSLLATPTTVYGLENLVSNEGECFLFSDGLVKCWNSTYTAKTTVPGLTNVIAIAAGDRRHCALMSDETMKCWGYNVNGALGDGTNKTKSDTPVKVLHLLRFSSTGDPVVSGVGMIGQTLAVTPGSWDAGTSFTYKWLRDGVVIPEAALSTYQVTVADGLASISAQITGSKVGYLSVTRTSSSVFANLLPSINSYSSVSAGYAHTCGLTSLGVVRCWGLGASVPRNLGHVSQISAGYHVTCAIAKTSSEAKCWANNGVAHYDSAPTDIGAIKKISAGTYHACAVTSSNEVKCWGDEEYGRTRVPADLGPVLEVSTGDYSTCALTTEGYAKCWGYFITDVPAGMGKLKQISVGQDHVCAIDLSDTPVCWGHYSYGELDVPSFIGKVSQIDAGNGFTCARFLNDQRVGCWGYDYGTDNLRPFLSQAISVSVGSEHACAVVSGGGLFCWGTTTNDRRRTPLDILVPAKPPVSFTFNSLTGLSVGVSHPPSENDGSLVWKVLQNDSPVCEIETGGECQVEDLIPKQSYNFKVRGENEAGQTSVIEQVVKFCPTRDPSVEIPATLPVRTKQKITLSGTLLMQNLCDPEATTVEYRKKVYGKAWTTWKKYAVKSGGQFSFTDTFEFNSQVQLRAKLAGNVYTTKSISVPVRINYALPLSFYSKSTKIKNGYAQGGTITIKFGGDKSFNGTCTVRASTAYAFNFALVLMGSESHFTVFKVKNGVGSGKITMRWNGEVDVGALCEDPKFVRILDTRKPIFRASF
jgi:alpha-tubulin suppressor-like RCC1 family protein